MKYRNGMLVALMEEYRKSTLELKALLSTMNQSLFEEIRDTKTKDKDCSSIQNVVLHIVHSGYTYANYINTIDNIEWKNYNETIDTPIKGILEIDKMLDFTEASFGYFWKKTDAEIEPLKFDTSWNTRYDMEQLMEHAIVHILRHRRQIETLIKKKM